MVPLDRWLPEFHFAERHQRPVGASPERAVEIVLALPVAPDRAVRLLLALRGIRADMPLAEFRRVLGFDELERTATSFVVGGSGAPWRPRGGSAPFDAARPGAVRMALAFWAEPQRGGSLLCTETRVAAVDEAGRRAFARYWRLIRPFSALIRRRWLRAAALRAAA